MVDAAQWDLKMGSLDLPPEFRDTEQGWHSVLPADFPVPGDNMESVDRSTVWLFEDGAALGPPHAPHQDIAQIGKGRYSHWDRSIWFSTSDNSDPNTNGRRYHLSWAEPVGMDASEEGTSRVIALEFLCDIIRKRGIDRIVYFHTDHFEPFSAKQTVEQWTRSLQKFRRTTKVTPFGDRQSLFYTPLMTYALRMRPGLLARARRDWDNAAYHRLFHTVRRSLTGDKSFVDGRELVFEHFYPEQVMMRTELVRPLEAEGGHEFHIHVHHEGWTASDHTTEELKPWTRQPGAHTRDADSLDRFLDVCKSVMEVEIGRKFDRWAFVHGNWALNGCNSAYCSITEEMAILKRHGCVGDFTFPAGDWRNDPSLKTPFTCLTPSSARAYDLPEGQPRPLTKGEKGLAHRFFVWNSELSAHESSLDLYQPHLMARLKQPEFMLRDWLDKGVVLDGCLYIKTHAHSADDFYRLWEDDGFIPHAYPPVQDLFGLLRRVAHRAKVSVEMKTVGGVLKDLNEFGI